MSDCRHFIYLLFIIIMLLKMFPKSSVTLAAVLGKRDPYMAHVFDDVRDMVTYLKAPDELENQYDEFEDIMAGVESIDASFAELVPPINTDKAQKLTTNKLHERPLRARTKVNEVRHSPSKLKSIAATEDKQATHVKPLRAAEPEKDDVEQILLLIKSLSSSAATLAHNLKKLEKYLLEGVNSFDDDDLLKAQRSGNANIFLKNLATLKSPSITKQIDQFQFKKLVPLAPSATLTATSELMPPSEGADNVLHSLQEQMENSKRILDVAVSQAMHTQSLLQAQLLSHNLSALQVQNENNPLKYAKTRYAVAPSGAARLAVRVDNDQKCSNTSEPVNEHKYSQEQRRQNE